MKRIELYLEKIGGGYDTLDLRKVNTGCWCCISHFHMHLAFSQLQGVLNSLWANSFSRVFSLGLSLAPALLRSPTGTAVRRCTPHVPTGRHIQVFHSSVGRIAHDSNQWYPLVITRFANTLSGVDTHPRLLAPDGKHMHSFTQTDKAPSRIGTELVCHFAW